jgi:hypothetical protein
MNSNLLPFSNSATSGTKIALDARYVQEHFQGSGAMSSAW